MSRSVNPYLSIEIMEKDPFRPIFAELFHLGQMVVLENQGQIVASCILKNLARRCHHVLQIAVFAVHPEFQGKQYGSRFMKLILLDVRENRKHIKRVELLVVADHRHAVSFYMKFGFKIEGMLEKFMKRAHQDAYTDVYQMALLVKP